MTYEEIVAALARATDWHKASYSNGTGSGCVEVASIPGYRGVRDTKLGADSPVLAFTDAEWSAFLVGVKDGEFE